MNDGTLKGGSELFAAKKEGLPPVDVVAEINNINRTIKVIEDKYSNLRKKVQLEEENSLSTHKKIFEELKIINSDIIDIKHEIEDIKEKILLIIKELRSSIKVEEFEELKKYIELWEPMNFVTRGEVKKIVEKAMEEKFS
ncbi:MAG: hypothetical protein QXG86_03110 [Candidatus Woesearchaeota archaeon]